MVQLSKYGSAWPHSFVIFTLIFSIGFDRCFQAFKLSIDVQLGAIELATPVLARTQILKFYQPHMKNQKLKTSIIAQTSAKAVDSLYARI